VCFVQASFYSKSQTDELNRTGQDSVATNPQTPQLPIHRSVHPLPPKPTAVNRECAIIPVKKPSANVKAEYEVSSKPGLQQIGSRRSASPPHVSRQENNYRQRGTRSSMDNDEKDPREQIPDNADLRRRGSAVMEVYR
jgi:hypothetical protein